MLAQQLANGVVLGSIYALSALGFTLIFGAARVVNFAYGELLMLGAFFSLMAMPRGSATKNGTENQSMTMSEKNAPSISSSP